MFFCSATSRSTWACELKYATDKTNPYQLGHAPRERVSWNCSLFSSVSVLYSHAPRERVSWNCKEITSCWRTDSHAPRERVSWNEYFPAIETIFDSHAPRERVSWNYRSQAQVSLPLTSRSTWACELKYTDSTNYYNAGGHAPRERVSWNNISWQFLIIFSRSRSTWACELKLEFIFQSRQKIVSRSTWACELKFYKRYVDSRNNSHAPRERVSWN